MNNVPEISEIFSNFIIEDAITGYTMAGAHKQKQVIELLIRNYS